MTRLILMGTKFTEAQAALVNAYAQERGLERPADILKALVRDAFRAQGIEFPPDETEWGGKRPGAGRKRHK